MTENTLTFDAWLRSEFVTINNELEALYWQQDDKANVVGIGEQLKQQLTQQGNELIGALVSEGNTDEGFDAAFDLLGNVGLYMAACRRHEITEPSRERESPLTEASTLAMHIGASIGVTPRFATAHLTTHNKAIEGAYKRFTDLADERLFVDYNTKGILAFKRAADALLRVHNLGVSHPVSKDLFIDAQNALKDVLESNLYLFQNLDIDQFFYAVRPYYKPYRVGKEVYRGANAGDFAGINVVDMLLGLCRANEPAYSQMLVDKFLYMMPEDQRILRNCMRLPSLMDEFLALAKSHHKETWFQENLAAFLSVCKLHGKTAIQHHNQLVEKYIRVPNEQLAQVHQDKVTASGPPLSVLLGELERLRDKRAARKRDDMDTRYHDIAHLNALLD